MSADTVVINGVNVGVNEIRKLIDLTEDNIKVTTEASNRMIKLTRWIFWLTLLIGIFTAIQILLNFWSLFTK